MQSNVVQKEDGTFETTFVSTKSPPELVNITYLRSQHQDFDNPTLSIFEMCSIDELKVLKHARSPPLAKSIIGFNKNQCCRTYPKGSRFDSSNYSPIPAWILGCQMVALNFQYSSECMWINKAQFKQNGGCGYVTKPYLITEAVGIHPAATSIPRSINATIKSVQIEFIAASLLPMPGKGGLIPLGANKRSSSKYKDKDVAVTISASVVGIDKDNASFNGTAVANSLIKATFDFKANFDIAMPELAILVIRIDAKPGGAKKSLISASFAVAVSTLLPGYRSIPLWNCDGKDTAHASMLVNIRLGEHY